MKRGLKYKIEPYEPEFISIDAPNFYSSIQKNPFFNHYRYTEEELKEYTDTCSGGKKDFKIHKYQEFVREFLGSNTGYNSILLYWGVGTGKTCGAIQIAENLKRNIKELGSSKRIYVIASSALQEQFKKQIYTEPVINDDNNNEIGIQSENNEISYFESTTDARSDQEGFKPHVRRYQETFASVPSISLNTGCTGNEYYINPEIIPEASLRSERRRKLIDSYYTFRSYQKFAKEVNRDLKRGENYIKEKYSNCVFIIDEVHNLNSLKETEGTEGAEETEETEGTEGTEGAEETEGISINEDYVSNAKQAFLEVFKIIDNSKLILLSGTPIRDNIKKELPTIVNLLRANDNRDLINSEDLYTENGEIDKDFILEKIKGYISYVKGENKLAFPKVVYMGERMPIMPKDYNGVAIPKEQLRTRVELCEMSAYQYAVYLLQNILKGGESVDSKGFINNVAPSNTVFPIDGSSNSKKLMITPDNIQLAYGVKGFKNVASKEIIAGFETFSFTKNVFTTESLGIYSPKTLHLLNNIGKFHGTHYVYADKIVTVLDPIAISLYYYGFKMVELVAKPEFNDRVDVISGKKLRTVINMTTVDIVNDPVNYIEPRCYCGVLQSKHQDIPHEFIQGKFTYHKSGGKYESMAANIRLVYNDRQNYNGSMIKVLIGSRVTAEGIDYKYISNIHIFNMWFNFTRIEQVIGRGSRNCSHRNITNPEVKVFNYISVRPKRDVAEDAYKMLPTEYSLIAKTYYDRETIDQRVFRIAEEKYKETKVIYRLFKIAAVDCYNNYEWNKILNHDSDGFSINYPAEDFSADCDFDTCNYKCATDNHAYKEKKATEITSLLTVNKIQKEYYINKILMFIGTLKLPTFNIKNLIKFVGNIRIPADISTAKYNSFIEALREIVYSNKFLFKWNGLTCKLIKEEPTEHSSNEVLFSLNPLSIPSKDIPLFYRSNFIFTNGPSHVPIKPSVQTIIDDESTTNVNISKIDIVNHIKILLDILKQKDIPSLYNNFDTLHSNKFILSGLTPFDSIYEFIENGFANKNRDFIDNDLPIKEMQLLKKYIYDYMEKTYRKSSSVNDFYISNTIITRTPATNNKNLKTYKFFNFEFNFICRINRSKLFGKGIDKSYYNNPVEIEIPYTNYTLIKIIPDDQEWFTLVVRFTRYNFTDLYTANDIANSFKIDAVNMNDNLELPIITVNNRNQLPVLEIISNYPEIFVNSGGNSLRKEIISNVQWSIDTFLRTGILHADTQAEQVYGYYAVDVESETKTGTKIVNQEINKDNMNKRNKPTGRVCKTIAIRDLEKYYKAITNKQLNTKEFSTIENICSEINMELRRLDLSSKSKKRHFYYYGDNDFNVYTTITLADSSLENFTEY